MMRKTTIVPYTRLIELSKQKYTYEYIAARLNKEGYSTQTGKTFSATTVSRIVRTLG
jgi:hypothetical protein